MVAPEDFPHLADIPAERRRDVARLHRQVAVIDGHCDCVQDVLGFRCGRAQGRHLDVASENGHVDFPRARQGAVSGQVMALALLPHMVGAPAHNVLKQYELLVQEFERAPDQAAICTTVADIERAREGGRLAAILALEGGEALEGDLDLLHVFYHLGVRMLGPVWFYKNELGDGTWEETDPGGLTPFGREVIEELNRLDMVLDTAHMPPKTFYDALETATGPVICSHAGVRGVVDSGRYAGRNLYDDQIRALAETGGVLGIIFSTHCLDDPDATVDDLVRFFTHAAELVGPEHIGFGSDFDGTRLPAGLEDISRLPRLTSALMDAGFSEEELLGILGGNWLRVFRQVWGA